jgi:hypothetical protein
VLGEILALTVTERYERYAAWCRALGLQPATFQAWYMLSENGTWKRG